MGQDQKVRSKHKRRTTDHKKHAVFPGMRTPKDVIIQHGSIKPISKPHKQEKQGTFKKRTSDNPYWQDVDRALESIQKLGGSSALSIRRAAEQSYRYAYRKLAQSGEVWDVKKKYRQ